MIPKTQAKKQYWSQLSDGISCLSWWFIIFMAHNCFVSRNGKKISLFLLQWNCIVQLQKTNSPILFDEIVEFFSVALGTWALQWIGPIILFFLFFIYCLAGVLWKSFFFRLHGYFKHKKIILLTLKNSVLREESNKNQNVNFFQIGVDPPIKIIFFC